MSAIETAKALRPPPIAVPRRVDYPPVSVAIKRRRSPGR